MFADLPLGTIITDEMRLERYRDSSRFYMRHFSCHVCGEALEYCGVRHLGDGTGLTVFLFYCKGCNANVEYTPLEKK